MIKGLTAKETAAKAGAPLYPARKRATRTPIFGSRARAGMGVHAASANIALGNSNCYAIHNERRYIAYGWVGNLLGAKTQVEEH